MVLVFLVLRAQLCMHCGECVILPTGGWFVLCAYIQTSCPN